MTGEITKRAARVFPQVILLAGALLAQGAFAQTPDAATAPVVVNQVPPNPATSSSDAPADAPASPDTTAPAQLPPIAQPPGPAADTWMPEGTAELRVMNKVDSHPQTVMLKLGDQFTYGSLTISVKSCLARPADQIQDWAAYLDVVDSHTDEPSFHGWTFANEPWIGMLEHPVYDVRLIACH